MIYDALCSSKKAKGSEHVAQIVLREDEAIQLAHDLAPDMGIQAAEIFEGILAGDAVFMGRKLLVHG